MNLKIYTTPLIKWWRLILAALLISTISSFLVIRTQAPIYQASATLLIGKAVFEPSPNSTDLWMSQQLANFYADIAMREPVRNATMKALGLPQLPQYFVRPLPNSQFIEIVVTDNYPQRAQAVANELANQLIKLTPTNAQPQESEQQSFVDLQLKDMESKIKQTMEDLDKKQQEIANMAGARQIADAQDEISALQNKLTLLQTNYTSLLANSQQGASNSLTIIEQASLPVTPIGPKKKMTIVLSALMGIVLASCAAYLLEFLDDTYKSSEEVSKALGLPVLGMINEIKEGLEEKSIYVVDQPRSIVTESFRSLRTNIEFSEIDRQLKVILLTSSNAEEGKTFMAINLATVMAQGGKRVVLLDGDMRRPHIHSLLGIANQRGLSDLFRGYLDISKVYTKTMDPNLTVITGGAPPPNPSELLGSKKMNTILEDIGKTADVIIVDGPPTIITDASILATKADGVLLVVRQGFSKREAIRKSKEQLSRVGAHLIGVVLNRIQQASEDYYSNYHYYVEDGDDHENPGSKRLAGSSGRPSSSLLSMVIKTMPGGYAQKKDK